MDQQDIKDILSSIPAIIVFNDANVSKEHKLRGVDFGYFIEIDIEGKKVDLYLGFNKNFPREKPFFFLSKYNVLGFLPHIDPDGFVCYTQDENLILDCDNPIGIIAEALDKVKDTINKGVKGLNHTDFLTEFEAYWRHQKYARKIYSSISLDDNPRKIRVGINLNIRIFGNSDKEITTTSIRFFNKTPKRFASIVYIPVKDGLIKRPPEFNEFWSFSFIKSIIKSSVEEGTFDILFDKALNKEEYIVLRIPISENKYAVVAIVLKSGNGSTHPLNLDNCKVEPILIERIDSDFIVPRGGGNSNLRDKKVLIIGCGSLGSQIINTLAKTGIGQITIIDNDILTKENIYRYLVGVEYLGQPKVIALKTFIEKQVPFIKIIAIPGLIEHLDNCKEFKFDSYDLIIFATGNPTINLYYNNYLAKHHKGIPVIYTWLEPLGIGGHTLLVGEGSGCYSCLYDLDLYNRSSFAHKNQSKAFTKALAGCGSSFVPFSFIDVSFTSNLSSKLALDVLTVKVHSSQLQSWKGNPSSFIEEGFKLSERHNLNELELIESNVKFKNSTCTICSKMT